MSRTEIAIIFITAGLVAAILGAGYLAQQGIPNDGAPCGLQPECPIGYDDIASASAECVSEWVAACEAQSAE